jgi:peptidoglycan/LPS O-acetylase OafA/YrhL
VLSGFLITSILLDAFAGQAGGSARDTLVTFWARRFRRLLPAVMALLAVVLAWLAVWGTPSEQALARSDARWSIPYLTNWHLIAVARDYWGAATSASAFNHLWSLAIEEQFYVVWPLVVWLLVRRRRGIQALGWLTAGLIAASFAAVVALYDPATVSRVYFGTDTRAGALLMGAFIALPQARRLVDAVVTRHRVATVGLSAVSAAVLVALWCNGKAWLGFLMHGGIALHSAAAALLIAVSAAVAQLDRLPTAVPRLDPTRWCAHPVLTWLGTRSYGIYLWHWPLIVLGRPRLTHLAAPLRSLLFIAASLALAETSFRLLERPIRRGIGWATGNRAATSTASLVGLATVVAVVAPSGVGHIATFDTVALAAVGPVPPTTTVANPATSAAPMAIAAFAPSPTTTAPTTAPTTTTGLSLRRITSALWLGDSVADDLAPALEAALAPAGVTMANGAIDGARFVPTATIDSHHLYDSMMTAHPVDLVAVQLSLWDSPASIGDLSVHLGWLHDRARAMGADIVFVTPPPVRADLVDLGLERQLEVVERLVAADPQHTQFIDSAALWGPVLVRDIDNDGAPDRKPDGVHICPQGAGRFSAWFVETLSHRFSGVVPVFPTAWLSGTWQRSIRYDTPTGACAAISPT